MTEAQSATHGLAVAIIPARGGSKGLPGKNVMRVGGVPLVARAVAAARAATTIGTVVVTTDDDEIARVARAAGATVVRRPADLAGDTASSEPALLHALDAFRDGTDAWDGTDADHKGPGGAGFGREASILVFIQATSPFIDASDLDAAVRQIASGERDSVFAAVASHAFLWADASGGGVHGVNHDSAFRARRQDRAPEYRETGAFYAMRTDGFRAAGHRFFGSIGVQLVPELHAVEIDTAADLVVTQALANLIDGPPHEVDVDAVITDFDGVHTDDTAIVGEAGVEFVRVSRSDGAGVARLRAAGVPVLICSAEAHPVVSARAAKLGVDVRQGVSDKAAAVREWAAERGLDLDRVAYLGNDRGDLPALAIVGWPVAVADAIPEVRRVARLVLGRAGGQGAVRELADAVLAARGRRTNARPAEASASPAAGESHAPIDPTAPLTPAAPAASANEGV